MTFEEDLRSAVKCLKEGKVIVYPTDTVWGIGCDATSPSAVEEVFRLKARADSKSLIVLVNSENMLERYVKEVPESARQIVELSDTPITIIYPGGKNLAAGIMAEDGSVGIRITEDPYCSELISRLRRPIVSTSANISGEPAPANFDAISETVLKSAAYVAWHRREDRQKNNPSPVIKIELNGEIKIIRK
jgi:L-threonylcarbamoyladenylate synthase